MTPDEESQVRKMLDDIQRFNTPDDEMDCQEFNDSLARFLTKSFKKYPIAPCCAAMMAQAMALLITDLGPKDGMEIIEMTRIAVVLEIKKKIQENR